MKISYNNVIHDWLIVEMYFWIVFQAMLKWNGVANKTEITASADRGEVCDRSRGA